MKITELKKMRVKQGFTQKEIAKKSEKAIRTYQTYESGECTPDAHTAQLIAKILDTTVEDLFPLPGKATGQTQES